jgi:hypothetical protein
MAILKPKPSKFWIFEPSYESPTHASLIFVKAREPNISSLGPFKIYVLPSTIVQLSWYRHAVPLPLRVQWDSLFKSTCLSGTFYCQQSFRQTVPLPLTVQWDSLFKSTCLSGIFVSRVFGKQSLYPSQFTETVSLRAHACPVHLSAEFSANSHVSLAHK